MRQFDLILLAGAGLCLYLGWRELAGAGVTLAPAATVPPIAPGASPAPVSSSYADVTAPMQPALSNDVMTLARTMYGEARGEGQAGLQAVASVVMNRVRAGNFPGGRSVAGVCRAPREFSCWLPGDPNLPVIQAVTVANPLFAQCVSMAEAAIAGTLSDNTDGATYYHDTSIATPSSWSKLTQVASIGNLEFFG